MTGKLTFDELKDAVASGEIDTVLSVAVDMQGRPIGKRFLGEYFVDAGVEETHCCNYLLTDDIDMEPMQGYMAAAWSQGHGDFAINPDLSTLPRIPWIEKTALVICDGLDSKTCEG